MSTKGPKGALASLEVVGTGEDRVWRGDVDPGWVEGEGSPDAQWELGLATGSSSGLGGRYWRLRLLCDWSSLSLSLVSVFISLLFCPRRDGCVFSEFVEPTLVLYRGAKLAGN